MHKTILLALSSLAIHGAVAHAQGAGKSESDAVRLSAGAGTSRRTCGSVVNPCAMTEQTTTT